MKTMIAGKLAFHVAGIPHLCELPLSPAAFSSIPGSQHQCGSIAMEIKRLQLRGGRRLDHPVHLPAAELCSNKSQEGVISPISHYSLPTHMAIISCGSWNLENKSSQGWKWPLRGKPGRSAAVSFFWWHSAEPNLLFSGFRSRGTEKNWYLLHPFHFESISNMWSPKHLML